MDLGENLQNAWNYTRQMTADLGRWIILIILGVIPIVNFILIGYMGRVVKEAPNGDSPPRLERYGELWVKGLKIFLAFLVYMLVPLIIVAVGVIAFIAPLSGLAGAAPWGRRFTPGYTWWPMGLMGGVGGGLILIGVIVAIALAVIAVIGIVHMVKSDQFVKAFAFGEIIEIIRKIGYGKYILWLIVVIVIHVVYGAIGNIPGIGWLITLVLNPPFLVFISRSMGLVYEEHRQTVRAPQQLGGEPNYCIQCGSPLPSGSLFCPKCGAKQ
ncbi:MAG: DUF4013 domain-containing protein [Candidatus Bathyarchaeia archaeon]